jgi:hypothetical protein
MDVSAFRQTGAHVGVEYFVVLPPPETRDGVPPARFGWLNGRLPALLLTLCLQIGLLLLLLHSLGHDAIHTPPLVRETYLRLPRLIEPRRAPRTIDARGNPRPAPPVFVPPVWQAPSTGIAPPITGTTPDIRGLGQALNNCAPENFANLTKEQRAHCPLPGESLVVRQAPPLMGMKSQVKDEAHWREELARQHSPALLPCMGGLDVICLLQKIATNKMSDFTDPRTWPRYQVEQIPPEDFYRIEKAYDEWHEAHPSAHLAPAH